MASRRQHSTYAKPKASSAQCRPAPIITPRSICPATFSGNTLSRKNNPRSFVSSSTLSPAATAARPGALKMTLSQRSGAANPPTILPARLLDPQADHFEYSNPLSRKRFSRRLFSLYQPRATSLTEWTQRATGRRAEPQVLFCGKLGLTLRIDPSESRYGQTSSHPARLECHRKGP